MWFTECMDYSLQKVQLWFWESKAIKKRISLNYMVVKLPSPFVSCNYCLICGFIKRCSKFLKWMTFWFTIKIVIVLLSWQNNQTFHLTTLISLLLLIVSNLTWFHKWNILYTYLNLLIKEFCKIYTKHLE